MDYMYDKNVCMHECFVVSNSFADLWTVAHQGPLSMGFSRQEYWSRLLFPTPRDLPHPEIEPKSLASPALAGGFFTASATWEAFSSFNSFPQDGTHQLPQAFVPLRCPSVINFCHPEEVIQQGQSLRTSLAPGPSRCLSLDKSLPLSRAEKGAKT